VNKYPPSVLIVDEDLGFLGWLGDVFNEVGYRALPALNCEQAVSLIHRFKLDVDVLAVDVELPGVMGMIAMLKRAHRPLKIVAIRNTDADASMAIPAHATLERPSGWEPISRSDWLRKIVNVLKQAEAKAV
jgi:DNA-binding response OmpR family regulator